VHYQVTSSHGTVAACRNSANYQLFVILANYKTEKPLTGYHAGARHMQSKVSNGQYYMRLHKFQVLKLSRH